MAVLHVGHGGLQGSLGLGLDRDVVLLSTELISKTSSVNHCLLGLLLGALGLVEHVVDLSLHGVDGPLEPALVSGGTRVDIVHLVDGHAGFGQLRLSLPLAPLGRVKEGTSLFHLTPEGVGPALSEAGLLGHLLAETSSLFIVHLSLPQLALVAWSRAISNSLMSPSSFFFTRRPSALAFCSVSREACIDSMARAWFLRVLLNSSSFSAILRSISCLTWPSSSWALSTLFSSASREPSASSRADWSSSFSLSMRLLCLSSSWMERPPSPS